MDGPKYLEYYVGEVPKGRKGIALSLDVGKGIAMKVRTLFERYKPTSLDGKTFVYSNDIDWSLHLREPSSNQEVPFLVVYDEAGNECFRDLFKNNQIPHNSEVIGEI